MQRQFELHPSHYLAAMLMAAHGATLTAIFLPAFPIWAKTALAILLLFNLGYCLRRAAWLTAPSASVALTLEGDQAILTLRNGEKLTGQILRDSLVTPYLTVLNVLPQGARSARSVVILPDSLDAESFRQLRVRLKWGC